MELLPEDVYKLLLSFLLGAIIGTEREYRSKSAGLRTMILIAVGSTLFTILSIKISSDAGRIAANIVTGIGFIGAGIIFRENNRVVGITTAAIVWVTAAAGNGHWRWFLRNFHNMLSLFPASRSLFWHQFKN
jgi:putative Mg2+ transporter-C (MgtC) family protein